MLLPLRAELRVEMLVVVGEMLGKGLPVGK